MKHFTKRQSQDTECNISKTGLSAPKMKVDIFLMVYIFLYGLFKHNIIN